MKTQQQTTTPEAGHAFDDFVRAMGLDFKVSTSRRAGSAGGPSWPNPAGAANDSTIPEGGRNDALFRLACSMRRNSFDGAAILAALLEHNEARCNPPLDEAEVEAIAHSAARHDPQPVETQEGQLTDAGNAQRFAQDWGSSLRYVPEWKQWLIWDDTRWVRDETNQVMECAKQTVRSIYLDAAKISDDTQRKSLAKHAEKSLQLPRLAATIKLAESIHSLIARAKDLDQDPLLLGVLNGVVDLRTGELREARPEDLMTMQAPVAFDPGAKCPLFEQFAKQVLGDDEELVEYFQRVVGYSITGKTTEQCLFFLYGTGANGKSTMLNALKALLGDDYTKQTPSETLMAARGGRGASNDLARLQGARLVLSNEVEEGSRLSESLIKQMTGGDPIPARYLYAEYFEFVPQFKIVIAGNHQPVIRGEDHGIWRRLHLVPFTVTIPAEERDPALQEKLVAELPGILNWAIAGCRNWQARGLDCANVVQEAVQEYREDMDILGHWIEECCKEGSGLQAGATRAYQSYKAWAQQQGHHALSGSAFGRRLAERYPRKRTNTGRVYEGLEVTLDAGAMVFL